MNARLPSFLRKAAQWVGTHRPQSLLIGGILVIASLGAIAISILSEPQPNFQTSFFVKPKPVKYYSPLTGVQVKDKAATTQPVTAIMIENSPDARPHSGLKNSGVVFEAVAEAGITRFLVLYQEQKPKLIGPVRSLRMYYVDWLAPFNASVAHVGGSSNALGEIRNGKYRDIDQFFNSDSYWRATDRYAPHNVYTSFQRLDALNKKKGFKTSSFTGFARADGKKVAKPEATSITINFSSDLYNTRYTYDPNKNVYKRFLAGAPHLDREAGQITPSVVIAMKVNETMVMEDGYREQITTTGKGTAYIFQNGSVIKATWSKASRASQISFKDSSGKEIELVRGQTWIGAVPNGKGSVSWR